MAFFVTDGARSSIMVPVDAVVACEESPARHPLTDLIDIVWNDMTYSMFKKDLRERCEPLD